jgi:phosphoenolpyruvate carboxykinase (GTP)
MGDYFLHWLTFGLRASSATLPKVFFVNWFRKTADGKWLWPGYGENSRVLKWVCERIEGRGKAVETPIGILPTPDAIEVAGTSVSAADMRELLRVDTEGWRREIASIEESYQPYGARLPFALRAELEALKARLERA